MTRPEGDLLTADVESAFPTMLRKQWDAHVASERAVVGRQGIFSPRLHPFGYELAFRTSESPAGGGRGRME